MPLTQALKNLIMDMDKKAHQILEHGGEEALLMSLAYKMIDIKEIIDSNSQDELNSYCQQYDGFYQYMNLLERMALAPSHGAFDDILK